jgi:hypothetical protein
MDVNYYYPSKPMIEPRTVGSLNLHWDHCTVMDLLSDVNMAGKSRKITGAL